MEVPLVFLLLAFALVFVLGGMTAGWAYNGRIEMLDREVIQLRKTLACYQMADAIFGIEDEEVELRDTLAEIISRQVRVRGREIEANFACDTKG